MKGAVIVNNLRKVQPKQNDSEFNEGKVNTHFDDNINMYNNPPDSTISLHEFQSKALSRLQILKKIEFMYDSNAEQLKLSTEVFKMSKDHRIAVQPRSVYDPVQKTSVASTLKQEERFEFKTNDNISHFICRLAYCRNEELRKWFITQEARLFSIRLQQLRPEDIKQMLQSKCGIKYEQVHSDDDDWKMNNVNITYRAKDKEAKEAGFYLRVPFKEAISLVGRRAVFILNGIAYVPITELQQIAVAQFRIKLAQEMAKAGKYFPSLMKDERLSQLLIHLSNPNVIDFNLYEAKAPTDADKINLADLDFYSRKSMPPCMKSLMTVVRNKHHLKHFGRLQLGLFLKGVGLTVDEAYTFWKQEFTKKMDADKFDKSYGYNIRHMYGQEGKKADYKAWSCQKVIGQTTPGVDEFHGCPFKTYSEDNLRQLLSSYGIKSEEMKPVLDKRRENLHQVACLRLYEAVHPGSVADGVGNHPNGFFSSSVQYMKDVEKNKKNKQQAIDNQPAAGQQQNQSNTQSNMSDITNGNAGGTETMDMN